MMDLWGPWVSWSVIFWLGFWGVDSKALNGGENFSFGSICRTL